MHWKQNIGELKTKNQWYIYQFIMWFWLVDAGQLYVGQPGVQLYCLAGGLAYDLWVDLWSYWDQTKI